jgi:cytochrome c-type biogenesis protein CcmH/NrfG
MTTDLEMTRAIAQGDAQAWNTFVQRYGDLVLTAVVSWSELTSRVPASHYDNIVRTIRAGKPEPADEPDIDREAIALFRYAMDHLKPRLAEYEGHSSLGTFLRLALRDVYREYRGAEHGRLTMPAPVAALDDTAQAVYRLGTTGASRQAIAERLGTTEDAVAGAQTRIRRALKGTGKEWWALDSWQGDPTLAPCSQAERVAANAERRLGESDVAALAAHVATCPACTEMTNFLNEADAEGGLAPLVAAPAWVARQAMDTSVSDAPEPAKAHDSFGRKLFSQPDWLLGLLVGAIAPTGVLLVLIPKLQYAKAVREPSDQMIARSAQPLSGPAAKALMDARDQLAKNKLDPAIQNLRLVLADRPDNQEARWLLATTFDRMGDNQQAAQQYRIFLDTEQREQAIVDDRVQRAKARLEVWEAVP